MKADIYMFRRLYYRKSIDGNVLLQYTYVDDITVATNYVKILIN